MIRIWHRATHEGSSDAIRSASTLGIKVTDVVEYLDSLDHHDPHTTATIILTSYTSASSGGLFADGSLTFGQGRIRNKKRRAVVVATDEVEDDGDERLIDTTVEYTTPLAGRFGRVWADEGHRVKNVKMIVHKFLEVLKADHYFFLTATLMLNVPKDLLGYLSLVWRPEYATDDESARQLYWLDPSEDSTDFSPEAQNPSTTHENTSTSQPLEDPNPLVKDVISRPFAKMPPTKKVPNEMIMAV